MTVNRDASSTNSQVNAQAVRLLQITKLTRSIGQGALVVAFTLYLKELGWSAKGIGLLLSSGGLLTAPLSLMVGALSDKFGRKGFMLFYEVLTIASAAMLTLTSQSWIVTTLCVVIGIGRNQSGVPGPMGPAEQAWMAEVVPPTKRGTTYSMNSALGFIGMGVGSVIAGAVPFWSHLLPGALAYRPLFALVGLSALLNLYLLRQTPGGQVLRRKPISESRKAVDSASAVAMQSLAGSSASDQQAQENNAAITRQENIIMLKMGLVNALNGIAVGLTSPLLSYWFAVRFGVGPGALGPVFAITFFVTGLASILTGRLSERVGIVRAVVTVRLSAVVMLLAQPLAPHFWLASTIHVLRSALSRGSVGARQALAVTLVRSERRGVASSWNSISMALPNSIGPGITGALMEAGQMTLPFYLAAGLQFLFGVFYGRIFQRYDPGVPSKAISRKGSDAAAG